MKRVKLTHGTARVDNNCPPETIKLLNEISEIAYKMETNKKLERGDFCENLTEEQYAELFEIEESKSESLASDVRRSLELGFVAFGFARMLSWYNKPTNLLTFEEFKQRAINTFKK